MTAKTFSDKTWLKVFSGCMFGVLAVFVLVAEPMFVVGAVVGAIVNNSWPQLKPKVNGILEMCGWKI